MLYLRHGDDSNLTTPDPKLNLDTLDKTISSIRDLISTYGIPDYIISSPMRRCRQTAEIIKMIVSHKYGLKVKISIDKRISRYFNREERKTVIKREIPLDNYRQFRSRVDRHIRKPSYLIGKNHNIWCITHYLVIKRICRYYDIKIPSNMPFLWSVKI